MSRQPDKVELGFRFGCGLLFGLVAGFLCIWGIAWRLKIENWAVLAGIAIAFAVFCGLLAMKKGDRFYEDLFDRDWKTSWWWW